MAVNIKTKTSGAQPPQPEFRLRADLKVSTQTYGGALCYVLKDPVTLQYFRFRPNEYRVLQLIQGTTIPQVCDLIQSKLGEPRPSEQEIEPFFSQLLAANLITRSVGAPEGHILYQRKQALHAAKRKTLLGSLMYIKFPGIDPMGILNWMYPKLSWLYSWPGIIGAISLWLFAAGYTLVHLDEFLLRLRAESLESFFTWDALLCLWLTLGVSKVIHEFGHGLTCRHFGGECHDMGVLLLVFSPALFCDTTDAWTMPNKWHRIAISCGGIYVELCLASIACLVWWFTGPGVAHTVALAIMALCSATTVLVNANPLMRYDGYYVLSDLLEIPNLRQKAQMTLQALVDRHALGMTNVTAPQVDGPRWMFLTYAVAAWLYRWVLCAVILWFFYNVLKPYRLSSLSVALAWVVGAQFFLLPLWSGYVRIKRSAGMGRKIRWSRAGLSAAVVVGLAVAVVFLPLPRRVWGVLTVQGVEQYPVFVPVPGQIETVEVTPGETIEAGQIIMRLRNLDLDNQIQHLEHRQRLLEVSAAKHSSLSQPGEEQAMRAMQEQIEQELRIRTQERERLVIRADQGGRVVPAIEKPHHSSDIEGFVHLTDWVKHPLRPENLGATLLAGTNVCDIQPTEEFEAVILVDQTEVAFLEEGQSVAIKVDGLTRTTLTGRITQIARIEAESPPPQLLVTKGGELPAKFNKQGGVEFQTTYYEVRARIESCDSETRICDLLRSGFRGRARIQCGTWTAWNYLTRQWNKIFHM